MKVFEEYNENSRESRSSRVVLITAALGISLGSTYAFATNGNVDLFSTDQAKLEDMSPALPGVSSSVGDGSDVTILGGARDMEITMLTQALGQFASIQVAGGAMSLNIGSGTTATATIQWDGKDDSITLDTGGLGGVDLTGGGAATEFEIVYLNADFEHEFVLSAWSDDTHWTSVSFTQAAVQYPISAIVKIPFSLFTDSAGCGNTPPTLPGLTVNSITCSDSVGLPGGTQAASLDSLGALEMQIEPDGNVDDLDVTIDSITVEERALACRMTGGGVDTDLNWDGVLENGEMRRGKGASNLPENIDRYQFGGQAGANTGAQPQPKGEWTHHQQTGPSGSFTFHAGTASAPEGTEIDKIICTDPGWCVQARPAPNKQIDFEGVGTFKNVGNGAKAPVWGLDENNTPPAVPIDAGVALGRGNKAYNGSFHWFEVNVDDLGEPRSQNTTPVEDCPPTGWGVNGDPTEPADCGCPDFYRIKIYAGLPANEDGTPPSEADLRGQELIYEAYGYVDGGNLQIHPPTGFDSK